MTTQLANIARNFPGRAFKASWNPRENPGDCLQLAVALKIMHRHLTPAKNDDLVVIRANGAVWDGDRPVKKLVSDVVVRNLPELPNSAPSELPNSAPSEIPNSAPSEIEATMRAICNVAELMGLAVKAPEDVAERASMAAQQSGAVERASMTSEQISQALGVYRACYRSMAAKPRLNWCAYKSSMVDGIYIVVKDSSVNLDEPLVENVQGMAEAKFLAALREVY